MDKFSFLGAAHSSMIEEMYEIFVKDPGSLDQEWIYFFQGFDFSKTNYKDEVPILFKKEFLVIELIDAYRKNGHLFTETNPVRERRKYTPTLDISNFGLEKDDLNIVFQAGREVGIGPAKLSEIITHLKQVYCQSIGIEYMYIRDPKEIDWIKERLHKNANTPNFSNEEKQHILHKLNQAVAFENFLHRKFVGQKRFSLEGAESLIPALDVLIEHSAKLGVKEFVMGMAHRGRLNVLTNIFNKTYEEIFSEFGSKEYKDIYISGDVKYHLGFTSIQKCNNGKKIKLSLSPNPSHLEAVDPIVQGITRAKIDEKYNGDSQDIVPILLHGDAALAGQGVVYEVIQMSQLNGYKTGGTIHIVINNQVGFTTNYLDARSSTYCTDVAKTTLCPVMHVNGDDVESVVHALQIAVEYRQVFKKDVFIDLLCYRKYGHNEGDEPRFTQPKLYKSIAKHPNPREIYKLKLLQENILKQENIIKLESEFQNLLQDSFNESKAIKNAFITPFLKEEWDHIKRCVISDFSQVNTRIDVATLKDLAEKLYNIPESKYFFKKTQKLLNDRRIMIEEKGHVDWAMAESLAYASLLKEGHDIRISGQDVERGTFSHRHAILKIEDSEEEICPFDKINNNSKFKIYNSLLSEYGVLGFDYGYSIASPDSLIVWEAQFGDFSNGAQIIIDQFISCAEDKWKVMSGLVLLLPHGYEGQGAEHSSARIERYLQLCAQNNMEVVNCTTPSNFFHVLRRQIKRDFRKPLIIFTPKSLLRHPKCISSFSDFSKENFIDVIDDKISALEKNKKMVLCSGKIYYDLLEERENTQSKHVVLVRVEQLYPLNKNRIVELINKYSPEDLYWVQEEPENMGPWTYILSNLNDVGIKLISRESSAATASGSSKDSALKQKEILNKVFK
tara:strand:+ start:1139 stop:3835 length:2697 start_codon:yes stop_codon:yes gene_type:complete